MNLMSFRSFAAKNVLRMAALVAVSLTNESFVRAQSPQIAAPPSLPQWSAHFDEIEEPDTLKTLKEYREQGWTRFFLTKGGNISGKELIAKAEFVRADLVDAIARDEAYLRRKGVSYTSEKTRPADCTSVARGVIAVVCDERHRSSQLSAVNGLIELLPAYSAELPAPPDSTHYGRVGGQELARVVVIIGAASGGPRRIDVTTSSKRVEAEVGDTLVVHLSTKDTTIASGVSITPPFDVLQMPIGRRHGPASRLFSAKAVKTGTATLAFFGPTASAKIVDSSQRAKSGTQNTIANAGNGCSECWAGYLVQGGPFGFISGSWAVPSVASDKTGMSSSWIGIDGFNVDDLIQIGTESDYGDSILGFGGGTNYYAWFELVPQTQCGVLLITDECQATISEPVSPGDQMFASITSNGPTSPNTTSQWTLVLKNLSPDHPWTFSTTPSFAAGGLSMAEWILEATTSCFFSCGTSPLPDFYPGVTFDSFNGNLDQVGTSAAAAKNPGLQVGQMLVINDPPDRVATPSSPDGDTDGFTVIASAGGTIPPPPLILITTLPDAAVGIRYSQALDAYQAPLQWSSSATGLPPGMFWSAGTISGTPMRAGTFAIGIGAVEALNPSASTKQTVSLTVLSAFPGPPDFEIAAPTDIGLSGINNGLRPRPCSGTASFSVTPTNGFSGPVSFSVPAAQLQTVSFSPNPVVVNAPSTSTTTLSLTYNVCPEGASLNVTAKSGTLSHSVVVPAKQPSCTGNQCP